jgi:hypothetical protein
MRTPLPAVLPSYLPDYAPGRIAVRTQDEWMLPTELETTGIRITIPRYALDVVTLRTDIDPDRVRWLAERVATRPLDARHIHLVRHRGILHLVDGHHALAAHLVTGAELLPVRLVRERPPRVDAAQAPLARTSIGASGLLHPVPRGRTHRPA